MKKAFIWLIVIVLIIVGSVWGTLMYLTDEVTKTNTMTIGNVGIELLEFERENTETAGDAAKVQNFNDSKRLIPAVLTNDFNYDTKDAIVKWDKDINGNTIKPSYTSPIWDPVDINNEEDKMVFVKNTGKIDAYVRIFFAFEAGQYASFGQFRNKIHLNINETDWDWTWDEKLAEIKGMKCFVACATYKTEIAPEELTTISLSQIALDAQATNADSSSFGEKYDVLVIGQGIQSGGFPTAADALNNGFGTDVPFEGFRYVTFADLKTALRNLNAVANNTITSKVNSVTFGLFKDHYEKIIGHEGAATKNLEGEEAFTGYTYYVPTSDGKYDIYVLTDTGVIYTPVNSEKLFQGMTVLTKVDTANLDVSKTTDMNNMFNNCIALSDLDVSQWDVSKVTNFAYFLHCNFDHDADSTTAALRNNKLTSLDVSDWDTASAINMSYMFSGCSSLTSLDLSNFNTAKTTTLASMFDGCSKLESVDMSGWDVSAVASTRRMFFSCSALKSLNFSGWHPTSLKNTELMFHKCEKLKILDLSSWGSVPLENISQMFIDCYELTTIYVSCDWELKNIAHKNPVFRKNTKLVGEAGQPFETKFVQGEEKYEDFARIAKDGTPGYFTYKPAENTTPEQKQ